MKDILQQMKHNLSGWRNFFIHWSEGLYYRFPLCCILQFSLEEFSYWRKKFGRFDLIQGYANCDWFYDPTAKPWNKIGSGYIPCDRCINKFKGK